jgi:ATP-dependent Clp protease adaptor protein ClpS
MSPATETPVRKPRAGDPGGGLDAPWQVIVLNDDHNTFEGVAQALSSVLPGVSFEQGMSLANRIHTSGRAVVWSGHKEQAELY